MLKGSVMIELHNHRSGSRERIEGNNMITEAISRAVSTLVGAETNSGYFMPLCNTILGGLMLFDGTIEESASNIFLPGDAHLVAYAGQLENLQHSNCGSLNLTESYETDTGFVTTWDFSTSQANGTIQSLARTYAETDRNIYPLLGVSSKISSVHDTVNLKGTIDNGIYPLIYNENEQTLYYIGVTDGYKYNSRTEGGITYCTHECTIYREYVPTRMYKVNDRANKTRLPEEVKKITFETMSYNYEFRNAYNGYAYIVDVRGNSEGDGEFNYYTLKLSDYSFELSAKQSGIVRGSQVGTTAFVSKNKAYFLSYDNKSIYIMDMENPADIMQVDLPENYVQLFSYAEILHNGGIRFFVREQEKNTYHCAIIYPDGYLFMDQKPVNYYFSIGYKSECMTAWGTSGNFMYNNYTGKGYFFNNFLGSIFNLSQPIEKTQSTSMKVVYTLNDI